MEARRYRDGLEYVEGASSDFQGSILKKDYRHKGSMINMEMVPFKISTISPQHSNTEREDELGGHFSSKEEEEDELELPLVL